MATVRRLGLWLSPYENQFRTAVQLAQACSKINLPGHVTEVMIPTMYGPWPQQDVNRTIGDQLAIDSPEDAGTVRALIEAQGVQCGGWSVPRGNTGNPYEEGRLHGRTAAQFDHFSINWEEGWENFWVPEGRAAVDQFLAGFWSAVPSDHELLLGLTFVTNSAMLGSASPGEGAAWIEGTHYVAIEAYIPGDPGLDPVMGAARMRTELAAAGHPDFPIVCILEFGDLPALAAKESHPELGVQVWTVGAALNHTWPTGDEPVPDPEPEDPPDDACIGVITGLAYVADDLGDKLLTEAKRSSVRKTVVRQVAAEMARVRLEQVGPRP